MATEKSELWQQVKERGIVPPRPFVSYTVKELQDLLGEPLAVPSEDFSEEDLATAREALAELEAEEWAELPQTAPLPAPTAPPVPQAPPAPARPAAPRPPLTQEQALHQLEAQVAAAARAKALHEGMGFDWKGIRVPVQDKGADRAGLTHAVPDGQPIRVDTSGRIWFRDEVPKPAVPRARMTRKNRYVDSGVKQEITYLPNGQIDDIYEVAGDQHKELTVTTTLPSWQVGHYRDPRFPFSVHAYNGESGFDFQEIVNYFGGLDLVPRSIKTLYVGNQLCYQISTARETIEAQYSALRRN